MKNISKKRIQQLNITLNEKDIGVINALRDKYAVNISGCFKIFIKDYLEKLEVAKIK